MPAPTSTIAPPSGASGASRQASITGGILGSAARVSSPVTRIAIISGEAASRAVKGSAMAFLPKLADAQPHVPVAEDGCGVACARDDFHSPDRAGSELAHGAVARLHAQPTRQAERHVPRRRSPPRPRRARPTSSPQAPRRSRRQGGARLARRPHGPARRGSRRRSALPAPRPGRGRARPRRPLASAAVVIGRSLPGSCPERRAQARRGGEARPRPASRADLPRAVPGVEPAARGLHLAFGVEVPFLPADAAQRFLRAGEGPAKVRRWTTCSPAARTPSQAKSLLTIPPSWA